MLQFVEKRPFVEYALRHIAGLSFCVWLRLRRFFDGLNTFIIQDFDEFCKYWQCVQNTSCSLYDMTKFEETSNIFRAALFYKYTAPKKAE